MLRSERKSLLRFLTIYLLSTMVLFTLALILFYNYEKHQILDRQREVIKQEGTLMVEALRRLHQSQNYALPYPQNPHFKSAIYDINQAYIFGDFKPQVISFTESYHIKDKQLYHLVTVSPYYLGAAYLLLKKPLDLRPLNQLLKQSLLVWLAALGAFLLLGLFLGRRFTAPMRQNFEKLNRFIQDTTHELNTPISTILTNIELLDTLYECEGKEERKRIEIASKTLSSLYDDMTYLTLNHERHRDIQACDISQLLTERMHYFSAMIEAKKIRLETDISQDIILQIDQNDAVRLIDNLITNAIKYNKPSGFLKIVLNAQHFVVEDSGIGMRKKDLASIYQRFERANDNEGGFGIGMNIVKQIILYYHYKIKITSKPNQGTKVSIQW